LHELQPSLVACPFKLRTFERAPGLLLQIAMKIECADRADARRVFLERERASVFGENLGPRLKTGALAVDDQTIEVEYQRRCAFS